jgi:hypothetical protein
VAVVARRARRSGMHGFAVMPADLSAGPPAWRAGREGGVNERPDLPRGKPRRERALGKGAWVPGEATQVSARSARSWQPDLPGSKRRCTRTILGQATHRSARQ